MMEWQPIETAPKDGTAIIGYGFMLPGFGGFTKRMNSEVFLDTVYFLSGLWQAGRLDGTPEITHWMPLPNPPKEVDDAKD